MTTLILIGLLSLAAATQVATEPLQSTNDSSELTTAASAPAADVPPPTTHTADQQTPKKPRRGAAPTADRISGVEFVTNPDGTMRREVTVAGTRVERPSDPGASQQPTSSDTYQPPERATVSSIHEQELDVNVFSNGSNPSEIGNRETPHLELAPAPELTNYEVELRNRMIVQLIGAIIGLGVLHLIQVKLKIQRVYFWLVVGGVIVALALTSYRPKVDPNRSTPKSDSAPEYAPMNAR